MPNALHDMKKKSRTFVYSSVKNFGVVWMINDAMNIAELMIM